RRISTMPSYHGLVSTRMPRRSAACRTHGARRGWTRIRPMTRRSIILSLMAWIIAGHASGHMPSRLLVPCLLDAVPAARRQRVNAHSDAHGLGNLSDPLGHRLAAHVDPTVLGKVPQRC